MCPLAATTHLQETVYLILRSNHLDVSWKIPLLKIK